MNRTPDDDEFPEHAARNERDGSGDYEISEYDEVWAEFDGRAAAHGGAASAILEPDPTGEIADATADLDDQTDELADPDHVLTVDEVEEILNRRWPESKIEPSLDRITALLDVLGNPQHSFPVIQVAGTNGKTSTARMIDALLTRIGVRTGRFTSPHLQSVTERISLDGAPISGPGFVHAYADVAPFIELVDAAQVKAGGIELSKFEVLTAMAYAAFADTPVDVGVIEVGLGGRWDSTNVVDAQVAVITPIGLDHTDYLGETIAEIAGEKAGIIKPAATVIIGAQTPEAMEVILRRTVETDATVARYGSEFSVLERGFAVGGQRLSLQGLGGVYDDIFLPLHGPHQAENAAVALAAVEAFFGAGRGKQLDVAAVQDGFAAVSSPGRLERVRTAPTVLIDAAHNPHGARALAAALADEFAFPHLIGVVAVLGDKDVRGILLELADSFDEVIVTVNSSPRSMPMADLAEVAGEVFGAERVHTAEDIRQALALAIDLALANSALEVGQTGSSAGVVVTGSVVSAGDARSLAGRLPQ